MKPFKMIGVRYKGNTSLLTDPWARIGVFASRSEDPAIGIIREQWARTKGRQHKCIIGTFHSKAEVEILYFVLKYGGSAVWIMGCSLPRKLNDFCKEAIRKKRLLIISCFHREHHSYATARYCAQLADMFSSYLAIWSMKEGGMIEPIYNRAIQRGKWVERF
ncbi:MAG: hypothetical protein MJY98_04395 [Fibrobacter sp.]|nr:hypothetical protein [Fibrobacter sp.]